MYHDLTNYFTAIVKIYGFHIGNKNFLIMHYRQEKSSMYFIRLKSTISIVIFYLLQPEPNWIQSFFLKNKES